jgi:putative acetyltransferase
MIAIATESPIQDDVRALIAQLNDTLLALTPREFCHHLTVEQMAGDDTTVFLARDNGQLVACGALKRHGGGVGEVKRMYTLPPRQGQGIGGQILNAIEALARKEGLTQLVLETGNNFIPAMRVYARHGFDRIPGPVLDYPMSPYTAFYEKLLSIGVAV